MKLTDEQVAALDGISRWLKGPAKPYFILQGYAGTGKTTLVRHLQEYFDKPILYLSYTGKAALNLRQKGCERATTIHQALYDVREKSTKDLQALLALFHRTSDERDRHELSVKIKKERQRIASPYWEANPSEELLKSPLIVVDEYSMVSSEIFNDLLATKKPILFVGDPAQLPPVASTCPIENSKADAVLSTVHRTGLDNPLLAAATAVRKGDFSLLKTSGPFVVKARRDAGAEDYIQSDQVLCSRNATRRELNRRLRRRMGFDGLLMKDERVIFLKNDHGSGVFNGSIGKVMEQPFVDDITNEVVLDVDFEYSKILGYPAWDGHLRGDAEGPVDRRMQCIDYAYAITVHKSQGSEWNAVTVHEEVIPNSDHKRLLYTALTRAKLKCTLIRP